jgi:hypothetical protein
MLHFRSITRSMKFVLLAATVLMTGEATVFAEAAGRTVSQAGGSWVWAYMAVMLATALGLIAVCLSSGRRDRDKPEVYVVAKKTTLKD